jgi:hypothetical protein
MKTFLLIFLLCATACATISFKQTTQIDQATSASSTALAFASNTGGAGANAFVIVSWSWNSASIACGSPCIADSQGNSWSCQTTQTNSGFGWSSVVCTAAISGAGGADTITGKTASATTERIMYIAEYQGVNGLNGPPCLFSSTAQSCNVTTTLANTFLLGLEFDASSATCGAGFTARNVSFSNCAIEDQSKTATGTYSISVNSSNQKMMVGLALADVTQSGTAKTCTLAMLGAGSC